eukprot:142808_1
MSAPSMPLEECDWCAAVCAQIGAMVFLSVYYHPRVLGTRWMKSQHRRFNPNASTTKPMAITWSMVACINALMFAQNFVGVEAGIRGSMWMYLPVFASNCIGAAWGEMPMDFMAIGMASQFGFMTIMGASHGYFSTH